MHVVRELEHIVEPVERIAGGRQEHLVSLAQHHDLVEAVKDLLPRLVDGCHDCQAHLCEADEVPHDR